MYCPNCGKIYDSKMNLKICEYCGENLATRDDEKVAQLKQAWGDPMNMEYFITDSSIKDIRLITPFSTINEMRQHAGMKPINDPMGDLCVEQSPFAIFKSEPQPKWLKLKEVRD